MALTPLPLPGPLTRSIGKALRERMTQRKVTLAEACLAAGVSEGQLSKMLHGKRRIDIDHLADLCDFLELDLVATIQAARGTADQSPETPPKPPATKNRSVRELSRRVRVLIAYYAEDAYTAASRAARRIDIDLSEQAWLAIVDNEIARLPDDELLRAWSAAFGVASDYLSSGDAEHVARIEAGLELDAAMRETRTSRIAARTLSKLGADEIQALARMIRGTTS